MNDELLVSVIIPCFNHGSYLAEAIESILFQSYKNFELLVVDDGSTDHSREVVKKYNEVIYIYQENQGLSAARNKGIVNSSGDFLVFLDADDMLYPKALEINTKYLKENLELAFVSGGFEWVDGKRNKITEKKISVEKDHYLELLRSNYISMHATVMYRRFVFKSHFFDDKLKSCEDYDMYLNVARLYPVGHHNEIIAIYRMHGSNMSNNIPLMLRTVLQVHQKHKKFIRKKAEKAAQKQGIIHYKEYYTSLIYEELAYGNLSPSKEILDTLEKYNPTLYFKIFPPHSVKYIFKVALLRYFMNRSQNRIFHLIRKGNKFLVFIGKKVF